MIILQNNKSILNGHKIFNIDQLFEFFSKKFKSEVKSESDIENILKNYENLNIAVRHADAFLIDEKLNKHDEIIDLLKKFGIVNETGKKK